jgi:hypothetical protein
VKFNPFEIVNAWITAANPTELQTQLAKERLDVCMGCDFRKEFIQNKKWSTICGSCGCPIQKKIFTNQFGSCPEKKWNTLEEKYKSILKKKKKSLI